ncbi:TlpA disulfide reductase family protein [Sphingobacterium sp. JUb56]|uniref:TlpA family protein disulfide reductase n=1 Tax=Sphingobacterium sp. JUb56 TaxID=2587145 RepID=UPI0016090896|nr:TlpA disulfide reductase family protein [Sphingobacterium sp. JUb56]MBB2951140.1 thiol-disulfide isomerase/thioredoxin [Sphingobacterium sp. JUb56]
MKYLKLIATTYLIMITVIYANGQTDRKTDLSKALKIGDTFVPPNAIQQMRGVGTGIDLNKLAGKVVILDFFDTYCGTCIQSMPKLQKLQNKLKDKVQIITVGWQDQATLNKFYASNQFLKENKVNLPVIYADSYLKERFPHQGVPHVVFLYKGKVQAITGSDFITEENILTLFENGTIDLPLKDDFGKGDLMGESKNGKQLTGMVSLSGYQNGVPFESFRRQKDSLSELQKTSFYNVSIYSAVLSTWAKIEKADYIPRPERLLLKVKNPNRYLDTSSMGNVWYTQHAISYERLDSITRTDSAQARIVLQDIHSFLGIRTYKKMHKMNCLILKPCPIEPYKGEAPLNAMAYDGSSVLAVMTDLGRQFPPVLDKVNTDTKITLGAYNNLQELNEQLAHYGIKAEIGIGEQEVLVIEELE